MWRYSRIGDLDLEQFARCRPTRRPSRRPGEASDLVDLADGADLVVVTVDGRRR